MKIDLKRCEHNLKLCEDPNFYRRSLLLHYKFQFSFEFLKVKFFFSFDNMYSRKIESLTSKLIVQTLLKIKQHFRVLKVFLKKKQSW